MKTIKSNLSGKSNAVLTEYDDGQVIAIISCGKSENITKKVQKAIAAHYEASEFQMDDGEIVLDNQNSTYFDSLHIETGIDSCRDFKLQIIPTY